MIKVHRLQVAGSVLKLLTCFDLAAFGMSARQPVTPSHVLRYGTPTHTLNDKMNPAGLNLKEEVRRNSDDRTNPNPVIYT